MQNIIVSLAIIGLLFEFPQHLYIAENQSLDYRLVKTAWSIPAFVEIRPQHDGQTDRRTGGHDRQIPRLAELRAEAR